MTDPITVTISEKDLVGCLWPHHFVLEQLYSAGVPINKYSGRVLRGHLETYEERENDRLSITWVDGEFHEIDLGVEPISEEEDSKCGM